MDISVERIFDKETITKCIIPLFDDIVEDGTGINALDGYVDVLKDWVTDTKEHPFASSRSINLAKSLRERVNRSIL